MSSNILYRGIDRLPHLPTFEEQDELRFSGRKRLADLWDRYWEAKDSGELRVNLLLAQSLCLAFSKEGIRLEVVYGELLLIPTNLANYPRGRLWAEELLRILQQEQPIHSKFEDRPKNLCLLGLDISQLFESFHSVIVQPGLDRTCPHLSQHLNSHGLFDDLDTAAEFLHEANKMDYGPLPFCVLGIWEVPGK
jgi:hypothetical protein